MKMPNDIVERLARGEEPPKIDIVGTNSDDAYTQANQIAVEHYGNMVPVLMALITRMQEQDKSIEMFEYNQKWRKRRP